MPTYDYRCEHCGHEFSKIQSFTEGAAETCPSCGKRPTRLMSLPSIVFKGSGWYKTDSRGKSTASDAGDTAKTDTKKTETTKEATKDKPAGSGGASTSGGSGGTST